MHQIFTQQLTILFNKFVCLFLWIFCIILDIFFLLFNTNINSQILKVDNSFNILQLNGFTYLWFNNLYFVHLWTFCNSRYFYLKLLIQINLSNNFWNNFWAKFHHNCTKISIKEIRFPTTSSKILSVFVADIPSNIPGILPENIQLFSETSSWNNINTDLFNKFRFLLCINLLE